MITSTLNCLAMFVPLKMLLSLLGMMLLTVGRCTALWYFMITLINLSLFSSASYVGIINNGAVTAGDDAADCDDTLPIVLHDNIISPPCLAVLTVFVLSIVLSLLGMITLLIVLHDNIYPLLT